MKNAYERFVRPLLFALDPETAHHLAVSLLRGASHVDLLLSVLKVFQPAVKPKTLFGLQFPNPIGLAAGFDKNGVALPAWAALGFGFIEIGTVTAKPQPGNPKPRIFRFAGQDWRPYRVPPALIWKAGSPGFPRPTLPEDIRPARKDTAG